jgi:hypothetical protein
MTLKLNKSKILVGMAGCGMMLALVTPAWSQTSPSSSGHNSSAPPAVPGVAPVVPGDATIPPQMEQDQARMRSTERQKQIVQDTDKLLVLATELKVYVEKTNKDMMSIDVIRKADEIEKLAHSVKEKMKGN